MIESPCKNVCELDSNTGMCLGCNRTIEEIINWTQISEKEKIKIIKKSKNIDVLISKSSQKVTL
jgi:predicted Fe-S protein YdhL (DUF1289 family)